MALRDQDRAALDSLTDPFCAGAFYFGLAWLMPSLVWPVLLYLAEFMVVDCFLSLVRLLRPGLPVPAR